MQIPCDKWSHLAHCYVCHLCHNPRCYFWTTGCGDGKWVLTRTSLDFVVQKLLYEREPPQGTRTVHVTEDRLSVMRYVLMSFGKICLKEDWRQMNIYHLHLSVRCSI